MGTKKHRNATVTKELLENIGKELMQNGCNVSGACLKYGISRVTFYRHLDKPENEFLREAFEEASYFAVDSVKSALYETALSGNVLAQKFYLYNRDPKNWKEKQEVEAHVTNSLKDMSDSELIELKDSVIKSLQNLIET